MLKPLGQPVKLYLGLKNSNEIHKNSGCFSFNSTSSSSSYISHYHTYIQNEYNSKEINFFLSSNLIT